MTDPLPQPLLEIAGLSVSFAGRAGRAQAVRHASLVIHPRQMVAVVGESGSGKTVTALAAMGLLPKPAGRVDSGSVRLQGRELIGLPERQMRAIRGREMAMIFQEPMTSLNPVFTVGEQVIEPIMLHQQVHRAEAAAIAVQAMLDVGIKDAADRMWAYPHEFSGGMRQRVMIAMALACRSQVLLADEPTTALDVTVQAQILELLRTLREERGMGIMLITHDLGIVAENADVVCVMLNGHVVEYADVFRLFENPLHPYTRGLLACKPGLSERHRRLRTIEDLAPASRSNSAISLREAEPEHWVADESSSESCVPNRHPALAFRRSALTA